MDCSYCNLNSPRALGCYERQGRWYECRDAEQEFSWNERLLAETDRGRPELDSRRALMMKERMKHFGVGMKAGRAGADRDETRRDRVGAAQDWWYKAFGFTRWGKIDQSQTRIGPTPRLTGDPLTRLNGRPRGPGQAFARWSLELFNERWIMPRPDERTIS